VVLGEEVVVKVEIGAEVFVVVAAEVAVVLDLGPHQPTASALIAV